MRSLITCHHVIVVGPAILVGGSGIVCLRHVVVHHYTGGFHGRVTGWDIHCHIFVVIFFGWHYHHVLSVGCVIWQDSPGLVISVVLAVSWRGQAQQYYKLYRAIKGTR